MDPKISILHIISIALVAGVLSIPSVQSANILGIFTSHSPSHLIVHMSVMKALAERGHNITVVCSQPPKVTHERIKQIIIPSTESQKVELDELMTAMAEKENTLYNLVKMFFTSMQIVMEMQYDMLFDKRFTALYETPDTKFDAVIVGFFFNDYQLGFGAKFGCPLIVDWTGGHNDFLDTYVGNPPERAYVPNMHIGLKPGEPMTFLQRIQNVVSSGVMAIVFKISSYQQKSYYKGLFPTENFPTYEEAQKNVSLIMINAHFSEGIVRPNVPALIEIGGIQVKDKPDPLPQDIADHLNKAKKHGAILFSLGSNVKSSNFKPETMKMIYQVLSKLKQNVIWKWEDLSNIPGDAPNILFKKWLPQDDILAHPNLRLFITHAGKGGITESSYHGVPMLALPIYADQNGNAERMVKSGYGLQLNMLTLKENELSIVVDEILTNPIYKDNVAKFSKLYRDRPLSAKESAVYWVEYVIRHKGAAHMQSPLVHMNIIQAGNLDVYGLLAAVLYVIYRLFKFIYFLMKRLVSKKCSTNKDESRKVKQN